jgi:hypothetical protein
MPKIMRCHCEEYGLTLQDSEYSEAGHRRERKRHMREGLI